jgi:hypothetical protein
MNTKNNIIYNKPNDIKNNLTKVKSTNDEKTTLNHSSQIYFNSYNKYIPYSISELEKQIKYFNSCAYYEYASALNRYLELLNIYKSGKIQYYPKYPNLCNFQPEPKEYKRPAIYQGIGRIKSGRKNDLTYIISKSSKYEEPIFKNEITLNNKIPDEIGIIIK